MLLYHTSPLKSAYGIGRIVSAPYRDATDASGKRVAVDIEPVEKLPREVSLAELKAHPVLRGMRFVRMPRTAVTPVSDAEWNALHTLARRG